MRKTTALTISLIVLAMLSSYFPLNADAEMEGGQTQVKPGMNFFSINQDIQLGRQAASEVERQYRIVNDPVVQEWVNDLGRRLSSRTTMPNLPWRFRVVNTKDVNAFALPGGFVYINRGLIEMTDDESEVAGVVGHEMAHVTLRHGTHQLSRSLLARYPLAMLGNAGGAAGAIGQLGSIGLSVAFLKFSRDDEKQADIVGVQTMSKAGYDPRGMITIFQRLERLGSGRGTPQFLSDHPNPENRMQRIEKEMSMLQTPRGGGNSPQLYIQARNRLRSLSSAPGADYRSGGAGSSPRGDSGGGSRNRSRGDSRAGDLPARDFDTYRSTNGLFQVDYPVNWRAYPQTGASVTLAPEWAIEGNDVSRGAIVSFFDPQSRGRSRLSLDRALALILEQLSEANEYLREEQGARYGGYLAGAEAKATFMTGRNNAGHAERVWVIARPSGNGVIYMLLIAPEREFKTYEPTFQSIIKSLRMGN